MSRKKADIEDIYHLHGKNREYVKGDPTGEMSGGDIDTGFRHSGRYHNFFEGYTEVKREKEDGRYSIERFYTDDWIVCPETGKKLRVAAYWVLFAGSIAAMLGAACFRCTSNSSIFGAAPLGVFIIAAVLLLAPLLKYSTTGARMTIHNYKVSSKRLVIFAFIGAGAACVSATAGLIVDITSHSEGEIYVRLLLLLLAALCQGAMAVLERKLKYTKETNTTEVSGEGFKIG